MSEELKDKVLTVGEAMAIAVLKGDWVAAVALADKVKELVEHPENKAQYATSLRKRMKDEGLGHVQSYDVWRWPEFQAFLKRLGVPSDLGTIDLIISLPMDGMVGINQSYLALDTVKK